MTTATVRDLEIIEAINNVFDETAKNVIAFSLVKCKCRPTEIVQAVSVSDQYKISSYCCGPNYRGKPTHNKFRNNQIYFGKGGYRNYDIGGGHIWLIAKI